MFHGPASCNGKDEARSKKKDVRNVIHDRGGVVDSLAFRLSELLYDGWFHPYFPGSGHYCFSHRSASGSKSLIFGLKEQGSGGGFIRCPSGLALS